MLNCDNQSSHYQEISLVCVRTATYMIICDPLSENPALPANIEFELEAILSIQVVFQLNSDYCTKVFRGLALYHTEL